MHAQQIGVPGARQQQPDQGQDAEPENGELPFVSRQLRDHPAPALVWPASAPVTARNHLGPNQARRQWVKSDLRRSATCGGYQLPVLGIEAQGSAGSLAPPFCSSSSEMPSGERTNAMWPSRGGRLMVTPASCSFRQVA